MVINTKKWVGEWERPPRAPRTMDMLVSPDVLMWDDWYMKAMGIAEDMDRSKMGTIREVMGAYEWKFIPDGRNMTPIQYFEYILDTYHPRGTQTGTVFRNEVIKHLGTLESGLTDAVVLKYEAGIDNKRWIYQTNANGDVLWSFVQDNLPWGQPKHKFTVHPAGQHLRKWNDTIRNPLTRSGLALPYPVPTPSVDSGPTRDDYLFEQGLDQRMYGKRAV